jgi:hypothetical protein
MGLVAYASSKPSVRFERTDRGAALSASLADTDVGAGEIFRRNYDTTAAGSDSTLMVDFLTEGNRLVVVPVGVVVERHPSFVTVMSRETGIFGAGSDVASAQADFRAALFEHRDVLRRAERLAPSLEAQLEFLERLLPE